jgi:outer membrane protein TolC
MKASEFDSQISAAKQDFGRNKFYPNLRASYSKSKAIDPEPFGSSVSNRLGMTLSQNLFSGFQDMNNFDRATSSRKAAAAAKQIESIELRATLKKQFNHALYLQDAILLARSALNRRAENVRIVTLRYEGGRENKSSALKTEAAKLSAEADVTFYVSSLQLVKAKISQLVDLKISDSDVFDGSLILSSALPTTVDKKNPKLTLAESELDASLAAVKASRSGWFPELTAEATAYKTGQDSALDPDVRYALGLTLSVPLFTPGQSSTYRQAILENSKNELKLSDTKKSVDIERMSAQVAYDDAKSRVMVAEKIVGASKMQAQVYRQRYTLGMVTFQDWDASEADLFRVEKESLIALRELADAAADLAQSLGLPLEEG